MRIYTFAQMELAVRKYFAHGTKYTTVTVPHKLHTNTTTIKSETKCKLMYLNINVDCRGMFDSTLKSAKFKEKCIVVWQSTNQIQFFSLIEIFFFTILRYFPHISLSLFSSFHLIEHTTDFIQKNYFVAIVALSETT